MLREIALKIHIHAHLGEVLGVKLGKRKLAILSRGLTSYESKRVKTKSAV